MKIPKIIHYCWFGKKPLPELAQNCIKSWKKYLPDYKIVEWNEDNFDVNFNMYTEEAYESKKYAFVTDVARLYIVFNHGGIYFDTDVEVLKSFDDLLDNESFFGFENKDNVASGLGFGAVKKNDVIKKMLEEYDNLHFKIGKDEYDLTPCPKRNTKVLLELGLKLNNQKQVLNGVTVYPIDYFNPKEYLTESLKITDNTYSIHQFNASWYSKKDKKMFLKHQNYILKYGTSKGEEKFKNYCKRYHILSLPYSVIKNPSKIVKKFKQIFNNK